ncbi:hypothetical protein CDAR_416551 [Caerostris darwini]|uniref:Uncharacterized protein n=1 Tax=Caerostris darwini TaxID=1538125 RepID=A0AAV4MJB3_9ARAC|nr:hypothetical protein CDAR_416551 [Caerostris darwini]
MASPIGVRFGLGKRDKCRQGQRSAKTSGTVNFEQTFGSERKNMVTGCLRSGRDMNDIRSTHLRTTKEKTTKDISSRVRRLLNQLRAIRMTAPADWSITLPSPLHTHKKEAAASTPTLQVHSFPTDKMNGQILQPDDSAFTHFSLQQETGFNCLLIRFRHNQDSASLIL